MKTRNLLIAVVLMAVLSGAVWYTQKHPPSDSKNAADMSAKIVNIADGQVQQIDLTRKDGQTVQLKLANGKWSLVQPETLAADPEAVNGITSALAPLTADSVVEEKGSNLQQYGLTKPSLIVALKQKNGKTERIQFGDDLPADSLVYVQREGDSKVYAVSSSAKNSFDKTAGDLRDKRLLTADTDKLTKVELWVKPTAIEFNRTSDNAWNIVKPKPYRADTLQVDELIRKLHDAKLDPSVTPEAAKATAAAFATAKPIGLVRVTDKSGMQTLELHKNASDTFVKSSVVAGVWKTTADVAEAVLKPVDDFRNKKLFDFGFSEPTRVEVHRGATNQAFAKANADWKLDGKTMDSAAVQSLIDHLRDVAASKFVDAGFTTPELTVSVFTNNGKNKETVSFAKVPDGFIARRENEPSLYVVDAKAVNDILEEAGKIKAAGSPKSK